MNDDLQSFIEPELEARLVALILGEASAFEEEELDRILKKRPEVALAKQRLEEVHGLIAQAMVMPDDDADWKLSSQRREKVLSVLGEGRSATEGESPGKERRISIAQRRSIYATAACLMVAVVVLALVVPMNDQIKSTKAPEFISFSASAPSEGEGMIAQKGDRKSSLAFVEQKKGLPKLEDRALFLEEAGESLRRGSDDRLRGLEKNRSALPTNQGADLAILDSKERVADSRSFGREKQTRDLQLVEKSGKRSAGRYAYDDVSSSRSDVAKGYLAAIDDGLGSASEPSWNKPVGYQTFTDLEGFNFDDVRLRLMPDSSKGQPGSDRSRHWAIEAQPSPDAESDAATRYRMTAQSGAKQAKEGESLFGFHQASSEELQIDNAVSSQSLARGLSRSTGGRVPVTGDKFFEGEIEGTRLARNEQALARLSEAKEKSLQKSDRWGGQTATSNGRAAAEWAEKVAGEGVEWKSKEDLPLLGRMFKSNKKNANLAKDEVTRWHSAELDGGITPAFGLETATSTRARVTKSEPAKPGSSMVRLQEEAPAAAKPAGQAEIVAAVKAEPIPVPELAMELDRKKHLGSDDGFGDGGDGEAGVAGKKVAPKQATSAYAVIPVEPASRPADEDPFSADSGGAGGGGQDGADPFGSDEDADLPGIQSRRGGTVAGGLVDEEQSLLESVVSDESPGRNGKQERASVPATGAIRSVELAGMVHPEEESDEDWSRKNGEGDRLLRREMLVEERFADFESSDANKARILLELEDSGKDLDGLLGQEMEGFAGFGEPASLGNDFSESSGLVPAQEVTGIATGGLRSGSAAVNRNAIDGILNDQVGKNFAAPQSGKSGDSFESKTIRGLTAVPSLEKEIGELMEKDPGGNHPLAQNESLSKETDLFDIGRFEDAEEGFKTALRQNPYSKEARQGLEKIAAGKRDYYRAAADETRAKMLMEVDKAWELEVPPLELKIKTAPEQLAQSEAPLELESIPLYVAGETLADNRGETAAKMQNIIIPELDLNDVTIEEAMSILEQGALANDLDGEGLKMDVRKPKVIGGGIEDEALEGEDGFLGGLADPNEVKIDKLYLTNVPLSVAAQYISDKAKLRYKVDDGKVTFLPLTDDATDDIVTRRFTVPPTFENFLSSDVAGANGESDPFATDDDSFAALTARSPIKDILKAQGVSFPSGASATLIPGTRQLVVRNTPAQLELIDAVNQAVIEASQEEIAKQEAKKAAQLKRLNFETRTSEKSDSTFSLNVSDVSFKLAKSSLSQGKWPEAAKIRPEEFVNALNYDDRKPSQSEKVACEIEQGTHPFMQQRNLMRVSMSTAALGRNAATPLRLTILLDQSGSMERSDRAESVMRAFGLLTAQLNAGDEVTLVGFARTPRLLAERVKGNESGKLLEIVSRTLTEGGTNLEGALASGIQLAKQQYLEGAQNRIILLTDGAANLGDALPANLAKQVAQMRQADIAFDACGVGADGLNDDILSSLTKQGDGRYYFLDRPEDADEGFARQIAGALRPAAKNVKVQVIFNPDRVAKFKLYGYEKHLLKKEDFRNDTVDAAEMAAEESGVALYHFEALPDGEGDVGHVSVRFLDTDTDRMVERTWPIPYEENVAGFAKADPALRLAGTAALFAEKLKASAVGERVDLKQLRKESDALQGIYQNQPRFQELRTMLQQAGE